MPSLVEIDTVVLEIFLIWLIVFAFYLSSLRKGWITSFEETGRSFTQNFFVPSLVEPSLVVQEKKIFKFCQCNFAITLFCGQKIIKYAKVRRLITSCHLIQHIKNTLLTANINNSFDQKWRLTRIVKTIFCAPKMETRASNGFSTLPVLSSQKTPSYYVLDVGERGLGKGDGILKPVLSKLCRSILISFLYIFFDKWISFNYCRSAWWRY